MLKTIGYYNQHIGGSFDNPSETKISLSRSLISSLKLCQYESFDPDNIRLSLYRPFNRRLLYFSKRFIEYPTLFNSFFPTSNSKNIVLITSGSSSRNDFSVLISDCIVDYANLVNSKCYPLYYYENINNNQSAFHKQSDIFSDSHNISFVKKDGISDEFANLVQTKYNQPISKEDIFYYLYALLLSKQFKEKYHSNLMMSPLKFPLIKSCSDFFKYSKAGRELANLHLNYEDVTHLETIKIVGDREKMHVTKMRFANLTKQEKDFTKIIFNEHLTIENIPMTAHSYTVRGMSAIKSVMESYQIKRDAKSGILIDPNDWGIERKNPSYILNLLLSVISLSVKTTEIINNLPSINFSNDIWENNDYE
ncbi:MAG: hypothetical protein LBF12_01205 [Christensenellaceae bacterium]|jgi:predicted helicase|nr:hypothetical protein [Christensenellaceae bacterium]